MLRAIGLSDELAQSSIRLSIGRFTKQEQIEQAGAIIRTQVQRLREISPL